MTIQVRHPFCPGDLVMTKPDTHGLHVPRDVRKESVQLGAVLGHVVGVYRLVPVPGRQFHIRCHFCMLLLIRAATGLPRKPRTSARWQSFLQGRKVLGCRP